MLERTLCRRWKSSPFSQHRRRLAHRSTDALMLAWKRDLREQEHITKASVYSV
nr:MAG TPA: hypothetical protein [Caudoviricetes sp.]